MQIYLFFLKQSHLRSKSDEVDVQASNTMVAGEQSPINITIKNTGEHENPNKEYTMTFSTTGQGVIKMTKVRFLTTPTRYQSRTRGRL